MGEAEEAWARYGECLACNDAATPTLTLMEDGSLMLAHICAQPAPSGAAAGSAGE